MELDIKIDTLGGNCPVQAEGTINGLEFYFRARHETCSLSIAGPSGDVFADDAWVFTIQDGDAGWLEDEQAIRYINQGAREWLKTQEG